MMKKLIALILSALLLASLCACSFLQPQGQEDPGEETQPLKTFTVTVVRKDGTSQDYSYQTHEKYVGPVLVEYGLIKGKEGPYGLEITSVEGVQAIYNEDKAYWALYEGEEYALQGIDTTPVVDGRIYKLVYTRA